MPVIQATYIQGNVPNKLLAPQAGTRAMSCVMNLSILTQWKQIRWLKFKSDPLCIALQKLVKKIAIADYTTMSTNFSLI